MSRHVVCRDHSTGWVSFGGRRYSVPNVFIARKFKALILNLYKKNDHFAFLNPLKGLGATYTVNLRLIGKLIVDFLLVIIELFFAKCYG